MKQIHVGFDVIKYEIIYKNNQNTYFRVKDDYVVVTTNKHTDEIIITNFLKENAVKFLKVIGKHKKIIEENQKLSITLWNQTYNLYISDGKKFSYQIDLLGVHVVTKESNLLQIKKCIYKIELQRKVNQINEMIVTTLEAFNIKPRRYHIKYLKSKFGSYHKKNDDITLNSYLATLEENYLIYVILHEYAHVVEFNHSVKFYALLAKMMPDYLKYHKGLKKMVIM